MIAVFTAVALMLLAIVGVAVLGPIAGTIITLTIYVAVFVVCYGILRRTDPSKAYRQERASRLPSDSVSTPATTPPRQPSATGPPF